MAKDGPRCKRNLPRCRDRRQSEGRGRSERPETAKNGDRVGCQSQALDRDAGRDEGVHVDSEGGVGLVL